MRRARRSVSDGSRGRRRPSSTLRETTVIDPHALFTSPNRLLSLLPRRTLERMAPHCRRVRLPYREVLSTAHRPIRAAHFVEAGVASVVRPSDGANRLEICLIGREGFCGVPLATGAGSWPYETFVQADELRAVAMDAGAFADCLEADAELRRTVLLAVHVQMVQVAEGLVSAISQHLPARLARWLLMYRDRIGYDRLEVTHEFIAIMVGVQRTGITVALHDLEGRGLIAAQRGLVIVRDRAGLEALAGSGYGLAEDEQRRLLVAPDEAEVDVRTEHAQA